MTVKFDEKARVQMAKEFKASDFTYNGCPVKDMKVERIDAKTARKYIASFHYSQTFPDSTLFSFAGYMEGKICGIICYGMGCGKNQYTALVPNIKNGEYCELTRLWCVNDFPKNTESKLIAESLKKLPPEIKLVVSFSDEGEQHCGIIYQATNWHYLGKNDGGKMLLLPNGLKKHTRLLGIYRLRHPEYRKFSNSELMKILGYVYTPAGKKHRYVYLRGTKKEKKQMYEFIKSKIEPYPKADKKQFTVSEVDVILQNEWTSKEVC